MRSLLVNGTLVSAADDLSLVDVMFSPDWPGEPEGLSHRIVVMDERPDVDDDPTIAVYRGDEEEPVAIVHLNPESSCHEPDHIVVRRRMPDTRICDECRQPYEGPSYYTYGTDARDPETWSGTHGSPRDCTDNLCPTCAGPYLEPDIPGDPRRPEAPA